MNSIREQEALNDMLKTPAIQPMHEYMYLTGVDWADKHPSEELVNLILDTYREYCGKNAATHNRYTFYEYLKCKL